MVVKNDQHTLYKRMEISKDKKLKKKHGIQLKQINWEYRELDSLRF